MYFDKEGHKIELTEDELKYGRPCCCSKTLSKDQQHEKGKSFTAAALSILSSM